MSSLFSAICINLKRFVAFVAKMVYQVYTFTQKQDDVDVDDDRKTSLKMSFNSFKTQVVDTKQITMAFTE